MTALDRVKQFAAAHALIGRPSVVMPHTDEEALALLKELDPKALKHGPQALAQGAAFAELSSVTAPSDPDEALKHYRALRRARDGFRQALEGHVITDAIPVTVVIRKRAA